MHFFLRKNKRIKNLFFKDITNKQGDGKSYSREQGTGKNGAIKKSLEENWVILGPAGFLQVMEVNGRYLEQLLRSKWSEGRSGMEEDVDDWAGPANIRITVNITQGARSLQVQRCFWELLFKPCLC